MRFTHWHGDHGFQYGWMRGRWWLSVGGGSDMYVLDVGTWRIRWACRNFRPLFSERNGYKRVHKIGRLALIHSARRKRA